MSMPAAHRDVQQALPETKKFASKGSLPKKRDKDVIFVPGSPSTKRRSFRDDKTSLSSHEGEDAVDGPLILDNDHKHEAPVQNEFSSRKGVAHAMMDAALFMANVSQLRMLLASTDSNLMFFTPLLCLIIASLSFQVVFAFMILTIWARESKKRASVPDADVMERAKDAIDEVDVTTQRAHLVSVVMVYAIVVTNMFITGLGIEPAAGAHREPTP